MSMHVTYKHDSNIKDVTAYIQLYTKRKLFSYILG